MPARKPVDQRVEPRRMVVVDGMAELVDDDEIAQVLGQGHQKEAQRDAALCRATPPLGAGRTDGELFVPQSRLPREPGRAFRQVGLGRPAQLLDTGLFFLGRKRRSQRCPAGRKALTGRFDPTGLFVQESQGPALRHPARIRDPHGTRRPHPNRDAPGPRRLRQHDLAQPRMVEDGNHRVSTTSTETLSTRSAESLRSNHTSEKTTASSLLL